MMDNRFLKLCGKSIKANRDKYARDFAVFSKKRNKKTRQILKAKRSDTFGNFPVVRDAENQEETEALQDLTSGKMSIAELEHQTKQNLLNARRLRRKYGIYIFPESETTPLPIFKFEALSSKLAVDHTIIDNLRKWKIKRPLPVQMQVIPVMLRGHELQCCAPTGSGKTVAFIVPILAILQKTRDRDDCDAFCADNSDSEADVVYTNMYTPWGQLKCLVVAPTTVLAHQIYREFVKYSKDIDVGVCLLDEAEAVDVNTDDVHVVISTPKPLAELIRSDAIPFDQIEIVVMDEADELFDGDTALYVDDIELIIGKCNHPRIQRAFFSATLDDKVMNLTQKFLNDPYKISIGDGVCGAANVEQELTFVGDERGKFIQLLKIIEAGIQPPILLFVSTNKRILELQQQLTKYQSRLSIDVLHEGLSVPDKNEIISKFRDEQIWFLISSDELTRGMDFLNVSTVINYDFPRTTQQYIHRIGRTGRADRVGKAVTFWCDVDQSLLSIVVNVMRQSEQHTKLPQWILESPSLNQPIDEQQQKSAKLNETLRGPIRRGGGYVHGTAVMKIAEQKNAPKNSKLSQNTKKHKKRKRAPRPKKIKKL